MPSKIIAPCSVEGCTDKSAVKGFCNIHYDRWHKYGRTHLIRRKNGTGHIADKYTEFCINNKTIRGHRLVAEKALGKPLPEKAVIHHVDGNGLNNTNSNLVICQDHAYHMLLHIRQKALEASGHADWRKCKYCKNHDAIDNLTICPSKKNGDTVYHKSCRASYARQLLKAR